MVPANSYAQTEPGSLPPISVADKLRIHALRVISPDKVLGGPLGLRATADAGVNLFYEFWPDVRKRLRHQ
jgi:hypothetical protein